MTAFPHPPVEQLAARGAPVDVPVEQDARFAFRLALPPATEAVPGASGAPDKHGAVLACYSRQNPDTNISVVGALLSTEVDPADWWENSAHAADQTVLSRRVLRSPSGFKGDFLTTFRVGRQPRIARVVATREGSALFIAQVDCQLQAYAGLADEVGAIATSLAPLSPAEQPYAEPMQTIEDETPFSWKTLAPASWTFTEDGRGESAVSLRANHFRQADTVELTGQLGLCVVARNKAKRANDVAEAYLTAVAQNEIEIDSKEFESEPGRSPFENRWYLRTRVSRQGVPGELRCRVMLHEHAWVLGGVLSPDKHDDLEAWMENKRVLDIATDKLELYPHPED